MLQSRRLDRGVTLKILRVLIILMMPPLPRVPFCIESEFPSSRLHSCRIISFTKSQICALCSHSPAMLHFENEAVWSIWCNCTNKESTKLHEQHNVFSRLCCHWTQADSWVCPRLLYVHISISSNLLYMNTPRNDLQDTPVYPREWDWRWSIEPEAR